MPQGRDWDCFYHHHHQQHSPWGRNSILLPQSLPTGTKSRGKVLLYVLRVSATAQAMLPVRACEQGAALQQLSHLQSTSLALHQ